MYKPLDLYFKEFTTANPSTGAAVNADTLPVATANHNGTDDGAFTLTVTNIDAGRYKIAGTVPSGYAGGDVVNITVAATCSSIAGKAVVDTFGIDTKRIGDLHDFDGGAVASVTAPVVLSSAGFDNIVVETGINARQALSPILAAAAGVVSGAGTGTVVLKGGNVTTTRITATTDSDGNRSSVTLAIPT